MSDINEKYRILTEKAFELICELDKDGNFIFVSPRYSDVLGYEPDDLLGKPFFDVVHQDDRPKMYHTFQECQKDSNKTFKYEYRGLTKWGQWRWFECTGLQISKNDKYSKSILISRDLKERKQTEYIRFLFSQFYAEAYKVESLDSLSRVMDKQFKAIDITLDFYIVLKEKNEKDFRIIFNNDRNLNFEIGDKVSLFGEFTEYIINNNKELIVDRKDFKKTAKKLNIKVIPASWQYLGVPINIKNETIGAIVLNGYIGGDMYELSDMKFLNVYAHHLSLILDNILSEVEKRNTENMLQLVLDNIPQYVFWKDRESRFLGCNKNMLETAGFDTVEDIIGKSDYDLPWKKKETEDFRRDDKEVIETGKPKYHIIEPQTQKDGSVRWHDTSKMPLKNEAGKIIGVLGTYEDITQRILQEEIVKNSELKYHTLFESSNDAIFLMTEDTFIDCNSKTLEMFGCKREEIIGKHPADFSPEYQENGRKSIKVAGKRINAVLKGKNQIFEWKHCKLDGTAFDAEVSLGLMELNQEKFILAVVRDISERKENLHELNVQKAYLEELFDGSPEATVILDNDDYVLRINREFTNLFGYTEKEVIGKRLAELIIPEEYLDESKELNERVTEGQIIIEETTRKDKNGREIEVSVIGNRVFVEGEQIALLGVYRDISKRVAATKALQKSEENLATILDSIYDAVIATDKDGNIIRLNPGAEILLDENVTSMDGLQLCEILRFRDSLTGEMLSCPLSEALAQKDDFEYSDCVLDKGDSEIKIRVSAKSSPIKDDKGEVRGAVLVISDITDELRLRQQLYESQKMEAVGQLAGGIAHDFNNLLAIIKGHSNIALMDIDEDNPAKDKFDLILRTVERSSRLIKQLLTFGRKEQIDPQLIDLNVIVKELNKMLNRLIIEKIELMFDQEDKLGLIYADPGQIEQVIVNMTINARDAMPDGGIIKITTKNIMIKENDPLLQTNDISAGKYVLLKIADQGMGIPSENLEKIFEPFYTTKGQGQGTGLGLSTVYGIVQQSKGAIEVESEVNKGTTFRIYFPVYS